MASTRTCSGWFGGALCLTAALLAGGCATAPTVVSLPPAQQALIANDDDFAQLVAQIHRDLSHSTARAAQLPKADPVQTATKSNKPERDAAFAARARALFAPLSGKPLTMPVVGVYASSLDDSWHASRDGGTRMHTGIDIVARRGTPVVAVTDGIVSFIGDQPKGGHCVWLSTEDGMSFYYAHLDRWAAGLYEGLEVQRGEILGYVGNTGNAAHTVSHLHFGINQHDEMVNPYPILLRAVPLLQAHTHTAGGGILGGSK